MNRKRPASAIFAILLTTSLAFPGLAQQAPAPRAIVPADAAPESLNQLFLELQPGANTVSIPGAQWLQLEFSAFNLGAGGELTVAAGDEVQTFDQAQMEAWQGLTAMFNGSELIVTLTPGDGADVGVTLGQVVIGLPTQTGLEGVGPEAPAELRNLFDGMLGNYVAIDEVRLPGLPGEEAICGTTDNRVPSTEPRVGRIMPVGCTGWIATDGAILTAGHCIGPTTQTLQFNVPPSQANGTTVAPGVADQYLIDQASIVDDLTGIGNDWASFRVFPNTQTGQLPLQAQGGGFTLSDTANPANVRITGFGVDGPPPFNGNPPPRDATNQTDQTHSGALTENSVGGPSLATLRYTVDTQGGNSGSPVIDAVSGNVAIGIHTNGGCFGTGGANAGTSFRNAALWNVVGPRPWVGAASNDPAWSDNQGWADVTNYSTIQAVEAGGDLYLLARANAGIHLLGYNRVSRAWDTLARNDPAWSDALGWADVTNYSTIQAVGAGGELYLMARANAGIHLLRWNKAANKWDALAKNDPAWADSNGWADVTNYSTIQAVEAGGELYLLARANAGIHLLRWNTASNKWDALARNDPAWADSNGWADVTNYSTIQAVGAGDDLYLLARANAGIHLLGWNKSSNRWDALAANDPPWSDNLGWADVTNYSTIQAVEAGGEMYLVARANAGIHLMRWNKVSNQWKALAGNDPAWSDTLGWADVTNYSTIQAVGAGGELYLLARANAGIHLLRWNTSTSGWVSVARNDPGWSDNLGWADVTNYATIQTVGAGSDLFLLARANRGMITLQLD